MNNNIKKLILYTIIFTISTLNFVFSQVEKISDDKNTSPICWLKFYELNNYNFLNYLIEQKNDGNYVIFGLTTQKSANNSNYDEKLFFAIINKYGNPILSKLYSINYNDYYESIKDLSYKLKSVIETDDKGYLLGIDIYSQKTDNTTIVSFGLIKLSYDGKIEWQKFFNGKTIEDIIEDKNNYILLLMDETWYKDNKGFIIANLSLKGEIEEIRYYQLTSYLPSYFHKIVKLKNSGFLIAGNVEYGETSGKGDIVIVELDNNLKILKAMVLNITDFDVLYSISKPKKDTYIINGVSFSTKKIKLSNPISSETGRIIKEISAYERIGWIAKIKTNGQIYWHKQFIIEDEKVKDDLIRKIISLKDKDYAMIGTMKEFNKKVKRDYLSKGLGYVDERGLPVDISEIKHSIFLYNLDTNGNPIWGRSYFFDNKNIGSKKYEFDLYSDLYLLETNDNGYLISGLVLLENIPFFILKTNEEGIIKNSLENNFYSKSVNSLISVRELSFKIRNISINTLSSISKLIENNKFNLNYDSREINLNFEEIVNNCY